ncbi:TPA: hypothetical protein EYP66_07500 [Candidatus Poribacteria bacterium]|nr:hypothetical protein [Candidatus Poribacteria bacterium]
MKKGLIIITTLIAAAILTSAILIPLKAEDTHQKEDIAGIVDVVRIWKLTSDLSLSKEQLTSFYPKFNQIEELRKQYWVERRKALKKLKILDERGDASEEELQTALGQLYEIEDNFAKNVETLKDELNSQLTLRQQVKFAISNDTFRRDVRQVLIRLKELGEFKKQQPMLIRADSSNRK